MKLILTTAFFLALFNCGAQSPYQFYRLYYNMGLSNSRVNAIVQDKQGYMWFGTQDGLNRYDGYTVRNFFADGKNGLTDNRISALYCDRSGRLWIGTYKGLMLFDEASEKFLPIDTSNHTGAAIGKAFITAFRENGDGNVYMATNKAVYRLPAKGKVWEDVGLDLRLGTQFTNISDIAFTDPGILWVSTFHKGFYRLDLQQKKATTFDYNTEFGDSCCYSINTLTPINNKQLVAGMHSYGMAVFNTEDSRFHTVPGVLGKSDSIRFNSVSTSFTDSKGRVWLGTTHFGLVQYFPEQNRVQAFQADHQNPFSYSGGSATAIYEDRQGTIWVGTFRNGVYRFHPGNSVVYYPYNEIRSIAQQDSASVWLGTEKGPVLYNWRKNNFTDAPSRALPADKITGILKSDDKSVWFATENKGLFRYDAGRGSVRQFSATAGANRLPGIGITNVLPVDEELWILISRQISRIHTKSFRTTQHAVDSGFAPTRLGQVSALLRDGENVWIGTYRNSLYQYNTRSNALEPHPLLSNASLTGGIIYKMVKCGSRIVCGTVNGIVVYDPSAKTTKLWLQHIPRRNITGLLADGESVWFSNEHTIGKINIQTGALTEMNEAVNTHFLPFTGVLDKLPDGRILCGTSRGFIIIDPARFVAASENFRPHITAFRVLDRVRPVSGELDLAYDQNSFSFEVSALDYIQADNIEYAYMLEGFDKDWRYAGKQRFASYTNVTGGRYQLKIKARHPSGEWIENNKALSIHIAKAFWQTTWFIILLVLLVAGIIYAIYRYRIAQVGREAVLKANYEIKLNELENSALRTQMNPHFIFNSLNTINSFISRNETGQAHQYISKFSRLIRYILDHSRQRKILLSDEMEMLDLYIQIERIRFENKFDYKIDMAPDIEASTVELPPLIIQPFVENAIIHGLLPLEGRGFLKISVRHTGDMLYCTVEDNGIGREKARSMRKDYVTRHKSHGIEITLKRIELFNKEHGKEGSVHITDLPAGGTKVEIPVAWEESF